MARHLASVVIGGAALAAGALALADQAIAVPSGQPVTLLEAFTDPRGAEGLTARFRFLAPSLPATDPDVAYADLGALCEGYALPRAITRTGPRPVQIVVSLADRPVPFGVDDPDALQLFESFDIAGGTCVPALF